LCLQYVYVSTADVALHVFVMRLIRDETDG